MSDKVVAGDCPNCGVVSESNVEFNFPNTPRCNACGSDLSKAGVVQKDRL